MNRLKKALERKARYSDYPPDDGGRRPFWKNNWICVPCQNTVRRVWGIAVGTSGKDPTCQFCQQPMMCLPRRWRVAPKGDRWWTSRKLAKFVRIQHEIQVIKARMAARS